MYEKFFGLRERPFDLTPNPRFLYFTARHREALINLEFGIESRKGVVVLIGEAGMGKTTVTRAVIEKQRDAEVQCVYLYNPLLTRAEFIEFLASSLHLSKAAEKSKTKLMTELASRLTATRQKGATVVLLIDEAQSLSDELLEELRMLTNIETHNEKLVTLVLVGQPQLAERLNDERLGQLKQRIELRCTLSPFDLARDRDVHQEPGPHGGRRRGHDVHSRRSSSHSRAFPWHSAFDQRHLRERPHRGLCREPAAGDQGIGA